MNKIAIIGSDAPAQAIGAAAVQAGNAVYWFDSSPGLTTVTPPPKYSGAIGDGSLPHNHPQKRVNIAQCQIVVIGGELRDRSRVAREISSHLTPEQIILLSPGGLGGALAFAKVIHRSTGSPELPTIAEVPGFPFTARSNENELRITSIKRGLPLGVFPANRTTTALNRLTSFLSSLTPAKNVLETSLKNTNNLIHPPIVLANAARIEAGDEFRFYREGLTKGSVRLLNAIDAERQSIARRIGVDDAPGSELMLRFYGDQGMAGETLFDQLGTFPPFENSMGPTTLNHRYIVDDIAFGLAPMAMLGHQLDIALPATESTITALSHISGIDLRKFAPSLDDLGLANLSIDEIIHVLQHGFTM